MSSDRRSFYGIDFSGARGPRLPGLQVFGWSDDDAMPVRVAPPGGRAHWSRSALRAWLVALAKSNVRALVGFDFSFGAAWCDARSYFPGFSRAPRDARALWAAVERKCARVPELYAGALYLDRDEPWAPWMLTPRARGARWRHRLRATDRCAAALGAGATPSSTFHFVGPGAVGASSVSGWRLLHSLQRELGTLGAIWPFDARADIESAPLLLVEVFPRCAWIRAGANPRGWGDPQVRERAARFGVDARAARRFSPRSEHEADAWIAAAALRAESAQETLWELHHLEPAVARCEGWIFGVPTQQAGAGASTAQRKRISSAGVLRSSAAGEHELASSQRT